MKPEYDAIYDIAKAKGCNPIWADGMFGWAWHCGCDDNRHGMDQQCSKMTLKSVWRKE